MTEFHVDVIVIGAGVSVWPFARHLCLLGRETLVIEKEKTFGTATSSATPEKKTIPDFCISEPQDHSINGIVNLFGIDLSNCSR